MMRAGVLSCLMLSCSALSPCVASDVTKNKDGTPPEGAPWTKDFLAAHQLAMQSGRPMFLYFTKTYCPHCVKFEQDVLTKPELKALYGQIVWVYVFRDFSESEADRAAERVEMRFGVSSYPQHILVDPTSLTPITSTGRTLDSFAKGVVTASRRVRPSRNVKLVDALKLGEEKAQTLETEPTVELAKEGLSNADIAVQIRAMEYLQEEAPEALIAAAPSILRSSNDLARYRILEVLEAHPDPKLAPALLSIVKKPTNSRNPNVLRIKAVEALGACGGKESLSTIAVFASSGDYLNTLTKTSVQALTSIAQRETAVQADVAAVLIQSFPTIKGTTETDQRYSTSLAETIHESLETIMGKKVAFPATYNQATRVSLMADWTKLGQQTFNALPKRRTR